MEHYKDIRAKWLLFCSTILLVVLTGCKVVGPDPRPPNQPKLLDSYSRNAVVVDTVPLDAWLQSWGDPRLCELLKTANCQNIDIRQACVRIVEARANLGGAQSALGPTLSLFSSYSFRKQSQNAGEFFNGGGGTFDQFTKGADAAWQIDLFGKIRRSIQAAEARVCFAKFEAQFIRQTLLSDTAVSYLRIRLLQEQIHLVNQSLQIQQKTQALVDERNEAGVSTKLDSAQTASFLERTRTELAALKQQLDLEFNRLSLLLGEPSSQELRDCLNDDFYIGTPALPQSGFPVDLIRNRPDVRRDEMAFLAALAEVGVAEADLYPQLSLLGSISLSATSFSKLYQTDSLAFGLGPSFRWDIFQRGRIKCNIAAAEERCKQAHLAYQQTVLTAVKEAEDSIAQYNGFREQNLTISNAARAGRQAVELSFERYKAGRANFQRVLDSQRQFLQDLQLRSSTRFQAFEQAVRLYNSLGGKWSLCECSVPQQAVTPLYIQELNLNLDLNDQNEDSELNPEEEEGDEEEVEADEDKLKLLDEGQTPNPKDGETASNQLEFGDDSKFKFTPLPVLKSVPFTPLPVLKSGD